MSSISFLFIITTELSRTEHVIHKMLNIYTTKSNSKRRISKDVIQQYIQYSCLVGWGGRILGEPHGLQEGTAMGSMVANKVYRETIEN